MRAFWRNWTRPVGVMEAKIKCPNASCPSPPGTFLSRSEYGEVAREVCGLRHNYTVLTEAQMPFLHEDTSTAEGWSTSRPLPMACVLPEYSNAAGPCCSQVVPRHHIFFGHLAHATFQWYALFYFYFHQTNSHQVWYLHEFNGRSYPGE